MIRPASSADLPRLFELLCDQHQKSKYYPDVEIDIPTAKAMLLQGIQRHGGMNNGSCCLFVEEIKGVVEGFIFGILNRVYQIGNRLCANDLFLVCTDKAGSTSASKLIEKYIEWGKINPKVSHIMLSWTDAIGTDGKKIEALYKRKGFDCVGGIFERSGE